MPNMKTLGEFIVEKQSEFPHASGELSSCSPPSASRRKL